MAHAQKPNFFFPRNGRVHLNQWGRQFSRLLAAEMCASAWVMLDTPRSEVAWEYWLPTPFASFPFTSLPVRHRVPPGSERDISHFLKKIFGLSLLPPAEVYFTLEFLSNLPNDKRMEQFCDYLLENYIDADSTFPPPVWSECTTSSRIIKWCELFHAHFNALFYSAHHNIFVLVSAL